MVPGDVSVGAVGAGTPEGNIFHPGRPGGKDVRNRRVTLTPTAPSLLRHGAKNPVLLLPRDDGQPLQLLAGRVQLDLVRERWRRWQVRVAEDLVQLVDPVAQPLVIAGQPLEVVRRPVPGRSRFSRRGAGRRCCRWWGTRPTVRSPWPYHPVLN